MSSCRLLLLYAKRISSSVMSNRVALVFDVDGTLSRSRNRISTEMASFLVEARKKASLIVVGGSDLAKIQEQLADSKEHLLSQFDYVFSENGLVGYKGTVPYESKAIQDHIGEDKIQEVINFALRYMSDIVLPVKRGNFVEFRKGMLNFSPIGRSCSQSEREEFAKIDAEKDIRKKMREALIEKFSSYGLSFAIGGQISIDVFPNGWDKTYCLQYFDKEFDTIHFFGDKTAPGGNDHEIFSDPRTIGHTVINPDDTRRQLQQLLDQL